MANDSDGKTVPIDALSQKGVPNARRRIKVLHLIHSMAHGGVETALINWLQRVDRERFEIFLICFANPDGSEQAFQKAAASAGIPVAIKIPWGRQKPVLRSARLLAKFMREQRIDILHTHNCYADCVGALVRYLYPVKTLTTLYVWSDLGWKRNLIQWLNRQVIRVYDLISAHCNVTYQQTLAMGFPVEKLTTLICGFELSIAELDSQQRLQARRAMGITDEQIVLANIARFYPEKVQDSLLRCFKRLHDNDPRLHLWLLGVGPLEEELRCYCSQLGLDNCVTFLGFVDNLAELLPLIDIQLHPAQIEGVPLSICSGMAASLPIVASDVGGIPEVLCHEKSALLVPRADEDAFVAAVQRLLDDPLEAQRLGQAARYFIEHDYSLDTAVRRLEASYQRLMQA